MIEPIMYFGIGFLVAALIGLVVIPLVHGRAVRLTMRRLEAATPLSMAEIQADKDQLRAEFAMSTRRLEMSVEQLKTKSTSQLAELGKKGDAINRLKIELGEKTATIFALEARDKALRDQLRATEEEFAVKTSAMHDAAARASDKEAELAKLVGELDERSTLADAQKVEIVALKTQVDALKERLTAGRRRGQGGRRPPRCRTPRAQGRDAGTGRRARQGRKSRPPRRRARAATGGADHRGRNPRPPRPGSGKPPGRPVAAARRRAKLELNHMRSEIETARKTETDLRAAIAELDGRTSSATEALKAEKAQLQAELAHANDERDRLARELGAHEARDRGVLGVRAGGERPAARTHQRRRRGSGAACLGAGRPELADRRHPRHRDGARPTPHGAPRSTATRPSARPAPSNGNLADRIRALQSHASRLPHERQAELTRRHYAASLDTFRLRSLYRPAVTAGRLAQRESVPFTRERS